MNKRLLPDFGADYQLLKTLILSSSNLPIGTYCYSQGIETAIDIGVIHDENSCYDYLDDMASLLLGRYELPMLYAMINALNQKNQHEFECLARQYRASRETRELLLESQQLAHALAAWSAQVPAEKITLSKKNGFLPAFSQLVSQLNIETRQALTAYGFAQLENAVIVVMKALPLGQMAGQRVLWRLHTQLPAIILSATSTNTVSGNLPNLAIMSARHETQHCRLFRS